jgi:ABC-type multidrug transport system permease subunit
MPEKPKARLSRLNELLTLCIFLAMVTGVLLGYLIPGIPVALSSLQGIARVAVYCSPITYLVAGFDLSLLGSTAIPIGLTWAALIGFSIVFVVLASVLHRRNLMKGL